METKHEFSLTVLEMGPHQAGLIYTGQMTQPGALALSRQFERLFGYYKYPRIVLSIESPGGALDGLDYVLRSMTKWSARGKHVAVRSTFLCASAGAFLLAMGAWGHRRVDKGTLLLFHNARIAGAAVPEMTAAVTTNISRNLSHVDRRILDHLIAQLKRNAGGAARLAKSVQMRLKFVDNEWETVGCQLSTIAKVRDWTRKPPWIKALSSWTYADPAKFVGELKAHLARNFKRDQAFDLAEAYVLCLIDEIDGVVSEQMSKSARKVLPNEVQDLEGADVGAEAKMAPAH